MSSEVQENDRLAGKRVILTGAAGNIGSRISRHLLSAGARLVMTGRNEAKLEAFVDELVAEGHAREDMVVVAGDCGDPDACRRMVEAARSHFGEIDVLINNAGTAGPKRTLREVPFTSAARKALGDSETMLEAAMNLLGGPWHMSRAAVPLMSPRGSIVNVSTIFSRTAYFGRAAYVVPKSGLNALSAGLARELGGERGIRVNTVYPGPIESDRIDGAFRAMDELQGQPEGTTGQHFRDIMTVRRTQADGSLAFAYPKPDDVAHTVLWLASSESAAFTGHGFEVTNGMKVPLQSEAELVSWPDDRLVDLHGKGILILGGRDIEEALVFAERNHGRGAKVLIGFRTLDLVGQASAGVQRAGLRGVHVQQLDPLRPESVERVFAYMKGQFGSLDGVIILQETPNGAHGYSLTTADDEDVARFVETEVAAPAAFASALIRHAVESGATEAAPPVTFVTNPDDGQGNLLNDIRRAAIEELIRVWRDEESKQVNRGMPGWNGVPNQIVRFHNNEPDNLTFAADWTATLNNGARKMDAINLRVPEFIKRATAKSSMPLSIQRVLPGLHHGKTALITGGSLGIGMQLGRYLALAGARVLLAARSQPKLEAARDEMVAELRQIGYGDPEDRIHIAANIDVGSEEALERLYTQTLELFGELDYLINNAGIAGAEEMVVDMGIDSWNTTLQANLISNYSLIRKFAPRMKARGTGVILNVSSYFGGEKYVSVAYPNRADYAVSKAGQRALAEILSRHLGPEIRINAMAPGPVDGVRLRGQTDAPGLFTRRGRLILENIRLNRVHAAAMAALEEGTDVAQVLRLAQNDVGELSRLNDSADALRKLFVQVSEGSKQANASRYLLNRDLAGKFTERLVTGGSFSPEQAAEFLERFVEPPLPFYDEASVERESQKIESGILNRLHLHKMPTDEQVSLSTVFSLADPSVSGETFHPSGGLKFDRSVTEGELMLRPGAEDLAGLAGKHVLLVGDAMRDEIIRMAEGFARYGVASLNILTRTEEAASAISHAIDAPDGVGVHAFAVGNQIEEGMATLRAERGQMDVVVSTPCTPLPLNPLAGEEPADWERVLSHEAFAELVEDHLTHHFRVARKAALYPNCQIVLVTPGTSRASTREEFALAMFIKTSMHAFTVTLGVEGERLPTVPAVNQVQLTRRARTEEPSNEQELAEEMERMVYAVLQCSVSAPSPSESRYLSRIFRGNAVTV
ncbi:MAG: SDR family NAD(P)-dependent oxidoreductase [Pseudomonadota bacterium]